MALILCLGGFAASVTHEQVLIWDDLEVMDKRLFLTVAACFSIFLLWTKLIYHPDPKAVTTAPSQRPSQQPQPTAPSKSPLPTAALQLPEGVQKQSALLENGVFTVQVSNSAGGVESLLLKRYKAGSSKRADSKHPIELVAHTQAGPVPTLLLNINGATVPFAQVTQLKDAVEMVGELSGFAVHLRYQLEGEESYALTMAAEIENLSPNVQPLDIALVLADIHNEIEAKSRGMFEPPPDNATPLLYSDGLTRHKLGSASSLGKIGDISWAGVDHQYFLLAAKPQTLGREVQFGESRTDGIVTLTTALKQGEQLVQPRQKVTTNYRIYAGPKELKRLKEFGGKLDEAVDYNVWGLPLAFLARPMLWLLNSAYAVVHSYGIAILILTLIVKLIMLPITQRSFVSMQKMKELKPELDKIKERFANDREKQGVEMMRLYKERKVSPFTSGCLPAFIQLPFYLALWRTLWSAVELYQQEFLWLGDLTARDPYYILPVVYGGAMFVQQKMSPGVGDAQQQKMMMYIMPIMMVLFMLQFPSGLVFYGVLNTILTIVQQVYIGRKFAQPA